MTDEEQSTTARYEHATAGGAMSRPSVIAIAGSAGAIQALQTIVGSFPMISACPFSSWSTEGHKTAC